MKIKKEIPRSGETVQVSFTAPAPGEYEIKCSEYCGRGHGHMTATLVVKPRGQPEASAARSHGYHDHDHPDDAAQRGTAKVE